MSDTPNSDYTYHGYIPQLTDLMPKTGGRSGVTYLQCTVGNLKLAQDAGWGGIVGGSKIYTVIGPEGAANMHLLCKGEPILGVDVHSSACKCEVDTDVEEITGLQINPSEEASEPDPAEAIAKAVKDTS